jgi:hypothetical protein
MGVDLIGACKPLGDGREDKLLIVVVKNRFLANSARRKDSSRMWMKESFG